MFDFYRDRVNRCVHLTLHAWPSSLAALWASTGLSITRPILPEKSMATREFSDTLRCRGTRTEENAAGGGKGQKVSSMN